MPSWTLLIAIFLAFSDQSPLESRGTAAFTVWDWAACLIQIVGGGLAVCGGAAFAGWLASRSAAEQRKLTPIARFYLIHGSWIVDCLTLAIFAWILYGVGWPGFVVQGLGLKDAILLDEALIIAPFLAGQTLGWIGLHYGELALRRGRGVDIASHSLIRELWRRFRQSMAIGLVMTATLALIQDVAFFVFPGGRDSAATQFVLMVAIALMSVCVMPMLLRWCWPSHSLPPGPLRDRLERAAKRFHFRCADILVWDTRRQLCTAAVAGAFPRFRYVFLTDALVDQLDDDQIEAVFGHEIGHVFHRHVSFFSIFLLGSLCVIGVVGALVESALAWVAGIEAMTRPSATMATVFAHGLELALIGGWFFLAFGALSRRFERQADLFACQTLSCWPETCSDASDSRTDGVSGPPSTSKRNLPPPCPHGIEVFASALRDVAEWNGIGLGKWSWRHGRMRDRIAFLRSLQSQPELADQFESRLSRVRKLTVLGMGFAFVAAVLLDALGSGFSGF